MQKNWHAIPIAKIFSLLKTSKAGLNNKQAKARQVKYGKNELPKPKRMPVLLLLLSQIASPLVYILLIAALISFLLGHITDAGVILFVVLINTFFGFWQESKANRAIEQLQKIVQHTAKVLRNGREIKINASELVPGDIIFLNSGDKVSADARLIEVKDLETVEASLTGESMPIAKQIKQLDLGRALAERDNMVYMGTLVGRGSGLAVVSATGLNTEIGKITQLIKETHDDKTPLQEKLVRFSKWLTVIVVSLSLLIFAVGFWSGRGFVEMFITAVALAVAAIPEGLLVAVTIILTIGMQKILNKKALVKKLVAAETLGSTSIICTDKTGTLTEGKMQVAKIITADKDYVISKKEESSHLEKVQDLISKVSVLCSSAVIENPKANFEEMRIIGDPTETALLIAAMQSGFEKEILDKEYIKKEEIPFSSEAKFMATIHEHQDKSHNHVLAKGAPELILDFSTRVMMGGKKVKLNKKHLAYLKNKYERLTKKGLRVLALAYKTGEFKDVKNELNDLVFLGFIALKDPLRPETKDVFRICRQAGIRPIVITGDHKLTAKAIFEELGLKTEGNIVDGKQLDKWNDKELKKRVPDIDIYARVEPRHKLRVVDAWQARGEVVAMTGDGVNDAPALKSADIGIALGSGSDVTKETADIILLDNNFKVIVSAVEQGRIIFDNIRKVITYLLTDSFSEMVLVAGSLFLGLPLPILATQILWINLVADGLPSIALTLEKGEKGIMRDKPRRKNESILNKEMKILIFVIGIITDIILLGLFCILLKQFTDLSYIRTIIFAALGFDSLLYVFSIKNMRHSILSQNPFSNKYLNISVVVAFLILISAIYVPWLQGVFYTIPLGMYEWLLIVGLGAFKIMLIEIVKHYFIVRDNKKLAVKRI